MRALFAVDIKPASQEYDSGRVFAEGRIANSGVWHTAAQAEIKYILCFACLGYVVVCLSVVWPATRRRCVGMCKSGFGVRWVMPRGEHPSHGAGRNLSWRRCLIDAPVTARSYGGKRGATSVLKRQWMAQQDNCMMQKRVADLLLVPIQ